MICAAFISLQLTTCQPHGNHTVINCLFSCSLNDYTCLLQPCHNPGPLGQGPVGQRAASWTEVPSPELLHGHCRSPRGPNQELGTALSPAALAALLSLQSSAQELRQTESTWDPFQWVFLYLSTGEGGIPCNLSLFPEITGKL